VSRPVRVVSDFLLPLWTYQRTNSTTKKIIKKEAKQQKRAAASTSRLSPLGWLRKRLHILSGGPTLIVAGIDFSLSAASLFSSEHCPQLRRGQCAQFITHQLSQ
jgi:hypothetical protein